MRFCGDNAFLRVVSLCVHEPAARAAYFGTAFAATVFCGRCLVDEALFSHRSECPWRPPPRGPARGLRTMNSFRISPCFRWRDFFDRWKERARLCAVCLTEDWTTRLAQQKAIHSLQRQVRLLGVAFGKAIDSNQEERRKHDGTTYM